MKIIDNDFTFTSNEWGAPNMYGTGSACTDNPYQGKIRMDLRGTDFHFHSSVCRAINYFFLIDNQHNSTVQ